MSKATLEWYTRFMREWWATTGSKQFDAAANARSHLWDDLKKKPKAGKKKP